VSQKSELTRRPPFPAIRNSQLAAAEFILIAMADAITPMMQQYQRLRGSVPADVLLSR